MRPWGSQSSASVGMVLAPASGQQGLHSASVGHNAAAPWPWQRCTSPAALRCASRGTDSSASARM
eukprot:6550473-Lingulodinium_polyedra.AAC.1